MWSTRFAASLTSLVLAAALFGRRSPYLQHRAVPSAAWADFPIKLVGTPWARTQKDDLLTTAATHMALLHNALIRGFNSIYVQAPLVQTDDVDDFIGYALTWHKFLVSHHDDEEEKLFPDMEGVLKDDLIWGDMKAEHGLRSSHFSETFLPGLQAFSAHLKTHNSTTGLSPTTLLAIMDSFREPLEHHLHHEVDVMSALAAHPNIPNRESPSGGRAADMLKTWGKNTVTKAGYADVLPFFLLNTDRTFEGGLWSKWPRMPEPVRWAMVNLVGMWHGSRWRFASCDASGRPRQLYIFEGSDWRESSVKMVEKSDL
ncbi:hypothetical protein E4U21_003208 [Claviceps maximensis]|nr:hypothetical protein E4U21_003208 [Claviceps maximensis]